LALKPAIQYVRSADGAGIAYWAIGEGVPLVILPNTPFSHLQLELGIPECRDWYERLLPGRRLVRYDARGFGLSARDVTDFTLEAHLCDLEAVVDRIGAKQVALYATGDIGMVAITYAARFPERVSHLLLWCCWARRSDVSQTPQTRTLRALMDQDWEIYTQTVARVLVGWENQDLARRFAAFFSQCTTPEVLRASVPAVYEWDATAALSGITAPALVMQRREMTAVPISLGREMAAAIPDSRFVLLEGASPFPWVGDGAAAMQTINRFLGGEETSITIDEPIPYRGSTTILFTDMESSTPLTGRLGDEGAQELVRAHNRIVRDALHRHAGAEIKHTGDGIMASFGSATAGLECAIDIQKAVAARNQDAATPFRVCIALNAGEPVEEEADLFGTSVQLAARIRDRAEPGQILVSNVVRELVAGKAFLFSDMGAADLKGFDEPVRLFELRYGAWD
jgi:class 3 adenylate cyclase/pimeloyl-ACP methyl ester carboxylesterase